MIWLGAGLLVMLVAISFFYLRGEDLRKFDSPRPEAAGIAGQPSVQHQAVLQFLSDILLPSSNVPRKQQLRQMRENMDNMGASVEFGGEIIPVEVDGIHGEWIVAPGADTRRRMLYIHGGAWVMGSPLSHRAITTHYARLIGGAVFALDYRLMPEHTRQAGIDDCRAAWRWLQENGPREFNSPKQLFISGDSAGANLALSLIAWIRDEGLRAPDAVVVLSPPTDCTFTSPSMKTNMATDHLLGPLFGKFNLVPRWMLQWSSFISNRIRPNHPSVSPVFGNLKGLPPTLVHVSDAEMLLDDAVRYVNKAQLAGSPVVLQTWRNMVHVWHIFVADLPEAQEAFSAIDDFLRRHGRLS